jgi:hypothetical protein
MGYLDKEKTDALNKIKRERKIGNLDSPKNPFDYYGREYGTVPRDTRKKATASLKSFLWIIRRGYRRLKRAGCSTTS